MWKRRHSSWARRRQGGLRVVVPLLIVFSLLLPVAPVLHASGGSAANEDAFDRRRQSVQPRIASGASDYLFSLARGAALSQDRLIESR